MTLMATDLLFEWSIPGVIIGYTFINVSCGSLSNEIVFLIGEFALRYIAELARLSILFHFLNFSDKIIGC